MLDIIGGVGFDAFRSAGVSIGVGGSVDLKFSDRRSYVWKVHALEVGTPAADADPNRTPALDADPTASCQEVLYTRLRREVGTPAIDADPNRAPAVDADPKAS